MSRSRVLIADDEAAARRGLRRLLSHDKEVDVIGESASGKETSHSIRKLKPDIIFLDIHMPDMDGFEVLATLEPDELPIVVFVTAYDQHSLKAFEVEAVDYLLKPFTDERFFQALSRAKQQYRQLDADTFREELLALVSRRTKSKEHLAKDISSADTAIREPFLQRFAVGPRDNIRFVDVANVRWIEAKGYRIRIHCEGSTFLLRGNIGSYEQQLNPEVFYRVSRSAIVNVAHVRSLRLPIDEQAVVVLHDGTELKVSRNRRQSLIFLLERSSS